MAETELERGLADVIDWRAVSSAQRLSAGARGRRRRDARFDLHALIELAERGCPPDLAVRILAPLEPER